MEYEKIRDDTIKLIAKEEALKLENDAKEGLIEAKKLVATQKRRKNDLSMIGQFFKSLKR
jgi:hypothetical protein